MIKKQTITKSKKPKSKKVKAKVIKKKLITKLTKPKTPKKQKPSIKDPNKYKNQGHPGNEFWKARSSHGMKKRYTPTTLLKSCEEYFKWITDNPLYASELVKYQGEATVAEVPKMRAMTIRGMCVFIGISNDTWANYRKLDEFKKVCTYAQDIIYDQKLTGAAADLLNQNIICRELGLIDKNDNNIHTDVDWGSVGKDFANVIKESQMSKPEDDE